MSRYMQTDNTLWQRVQNRLLLRLSRHPLMVPTDRPVVSFTFDDVPETAWTNGARILEHHGVRGTFYIAGGMLGLVEPDRTLISLSGCQALQAAGHEIGCHTFSHPRVSTVARATLEADLLRNQDCLAPALPDGPPRNFAYPYNAGSWHNRDVFRRRYRSCRGGGNRINRGPVNPLYLAGMEIRQPESHALALSRQIDALMEQPGWLIFFTHDIADTPTRFGCTPQTFSRLVGHALERGCEVLTVAAALNRFAPDANHN